MADYFTHFSCILDLPDPALAAAAAELHEAFDGRLRNDEGRLAGFALTAQPSDNPTRIWIHDDDSHGMPDDVIAFVAELGPALRLTGLWGFEWAHTCSKPRIDAFGGGACIIDLATGETHDTISTNEWLTRTLADPLNNGEDWAMRIVETPVYDFTDLSAAAKDKARAWFRETIDHDWWDSVYDDFEQICPILGVTLATTTVRLMGGGTRQKPCIWFSGFWSQGDGACFEGSYAYAQRASRRIRDYAPQDKELHRIADALQALQNPNFYQLTASFRQTGRYYGMTVDVDRDSPTGHPIVNRADDDLVTAMRDLAHWLYRALEREYQFQTSDETVDEGMSANGYTFTAEGRRFG